MLHELAYLTFLLSLTLSIWLLGAKWENSGAQSDRWKPLTSAGDPSDHMLSVRSVLSQT